MGISVRTLSFIQFMSKSTRLKKLEPICLLILVQFMILLIYENEERNKGIDQNVTKINQNVHLNRSDR